MQETQPPEGSNLKEAFAGTSESIEDQMNARLGELHDHKLVQRKPITFPEALELEIERCEKLVSTGTPMSKAAIRNALNEARDSLAKFEKLQKRVVRSFAHLKEFK